MSEEGSPHPVVPDSITPVEGWKMLSFHAEKLASPGYPMAWVVGRQAHARCELDLYEYHWVVSDERPVVEAEEEVTTAGYTFTTLHPVRFTPIPTLVSTSPTSVIGSPGLKHPPVPKTELPKGKYWRAETRKVKHEAPTESCSCGIYIAREIGAAAGYQGDVLAKVQGWGNTIEHESGWRCQYAYPSHLYATSLEQALALADYGVPVTLLDDVDDPEVEKMIDALRVAELTLLPEHPTARFVRKAGVVAPMVIAAMVIMQGAIVISRPSVIGAISFGISSLCLGFTLALRFLR